MILYYSILLLLLSVDSSKSMDYESDYDEQSYDYDIRKREDEIWILDCNTNVGTVLFNGQCKKCYSQEEIALLSTRKEFDVLLPYNKNVIESDRSIEILIEYFFSINEVIVTMSDGESKTYALKAFYDTLGGYLHHYLIPTTKLSFYAGEISLRSTKCVFDLFDHCKNCLNTNGVGWAKPISDFSSYNLKIEPLNILPKDDLNNEKRETSDEEKQHQITPCISLVLLDDDSDSEEDIIISLPKIDVEDDNLITNMWLPYKRKHIFNLQSRSSAFILMRYYVDVTKCYKSQSISQESFNKKLYDWLIENIIPRLFGLEFYPSLGAVLRILETVKSGNKTLILSGNQLMEEAIKGKKIHKGLKLIEPNDDEILLIQEQVKHVMNTESTNFFEKMFKHKNDDEEANIKFWLLQITILIIMIIFIAVMLIACFIRYRRKSMIQKQCGPNTNDEIEIASNSGAINGGRRASDLSAQSQKSGSSSLAIREVKLDTNSNNHNGSRASLQETTKTPPIITPSEHTNNNEKSTRTGIFRTPFGKAPSTK